MDHDPQPHSSGNRFMRLAATLVLVLAVICGYELLRVRPLMLQLAAAREELEREKATAADLEERNRNQERLLGQIAAAASTPAGE